MKKSRFTESKIIKAFQEQQQGRNVQEIAVELSIDTVLFIIGVSAMGRYGSSRAQVFKRVRRREP